MTLGQGVGGLGAGAYIQEDAAIRINVGGFKKKLWSNTLSRFPETRLARLLT